MNCRCPPHVQVRAPVYGRVCLPFLLAVLLSGASGCQPAKYAAGTSQVRQTRASLLKEGRRLAQQGQNLRAEQYLLAVLESGGRESAEAFPLLVQVCIESGRYGSALRHVEARLLERPGNAVLLDLKAVLREGLGLSGGDS